jgi:outer membrane autotransporter protein
MSIGVYGSYVLPNSLFFDLTASYGHSQNDSSVSLPLGGTKSGSFDINTWLVGARVGKIISLDSINITPTIGLRYLSVHQDGWRETISGGGVGLANWFSKRNEQIVEVPLQVKINGSFSSGSVSITPELRLGWTFLAKKPDNELNIGFVGSAMSTAVYGTRPKSSSFQAGAGVKVSITQNVDAFINYDLDLAKGYRNHVASGGLAFNF